MGASAANLWLLLFRATRNWEFCILQERSHIFFPFSMWKIYLKYLLQEKSPPSHYGKLHKNKIAALVIKSYHSEVSQTMKKKKRKEKGRAQSCLSLWEPMDCSLLGSSVHGIFQARILEWGALSYSRRSSRPRDRTCVSCIGRWILYHWATWELLQTMNHLWNLLTDFSVLIQICLCIFIHVTIYCIKLESYSTNWFMSCFLKNEYL